jgi:hypothetical protein
MRFIFACLLCSAIAFVVGCGKSDNFGNASADGTYTVEFKDNGCDTLKHVFNGLSNYCSGLEDEALNHGCAQPERREAFIVDHCPGTFQPTDA